MGFARRVKPKIIYNKKDISQDIAPYLKGFSYTDELSGSADDISITLDDCDKLWQGDWMPIKGDTLEVSLISLYWHATNEQAIEFQLGTFEIDEIELKKSPTEVTIKAVSVPNDTTLRGVERSRSWEKVSVWKIATDIASDAQFELFWDCKENPNVERIEQTEQSDLSFLQKLCSDNGLALKVSDKKIIIFDETKYEEAETAAIFSKIPIIQSADTQSNNAGGNQEQTKLNIYRFLNYRFSTSIRDVYKSCRVIYQKGKDKEKIDVTFTDPKKDNGKILICHNQVDSIVEAENMAKKELRKKNQDEVKGKLSLHGDFSYAAGLTYDIQGFGYFDGKYIATRVTHELSSGYTCNIDLRRCLDGY